MVYNNELYMWWTSTLTWFMSIIITIMVFVITIMVFKINNRIDDNSSSPNSDCNLGPTGPTGQYEERFKKNTN